MPPPASNVEQNPLVRSQLAELAAALSQLASLSHAHNSQLRRTGEEAERFGRTLDEARNNLHREFRDLLVAVHFTGEALQRHAKSSAGGSSSGSDRGQMAHLVHVGRMQVFWLSRIHSALGRPSAAGGVPSQPFGARPPGFQPTSQDILRGLVTARELDRDRGRPVRGGAIARPIVTPAPAAVPARGTVMARPVFKVPRIPKPPVVGGPGAAGAGLAAFTAAINVAITAVQTWADVLTSLVRTASPNVWRTFTGSIQLLMARIGLTLVPTFVELAGFIQKLAEDFQELRSETKSLIGHFLTLRDFFGSFSDTFTGPKGRFDVLTSKDSTVTERLRAIPMPGLGFEVLKNSILRGHETVQRANRGEEQPGLGLPGPKNFLMDVKTQEPKFTAVESVWEQMALGFLRETDFDREMMKIAQEAVAKLTEIAAKQQRPKPGS